MRVALRHDTLQGWTMKYFDDLAAGSVTECGSFSFTREEIFDFARRYDPQPFHLEDEAAKHSVFGRLTASGLQSACTARKLMLQSVLADRRFLGSPGATRMQMHKPVYPGTVVRVTHTIKNVLRLADWPAVALVEGCTLGLASDGELIMTVEDHSWIGSRALPDDFAASLLVDSPSASAPFEIMHDRPDLVGQSRTSTPDGRLYWEDCPVGATFYSDEFAVSAAEIESFHAQFDPAPPRSGGTAHANGWHGICLGMRVTGDAFWNRFENVGGTGLDFVRWPHELQPGDRLRGEATIVHSRPLRTRPGLGLVQIRCVFVNQRGQVVSSFVSSTFARMRAAQ